MQLIHPAQLRWSSIQMDYYHTGHYTETRMTSLQSPHQLINERKLAILVKPNTPEDIELDVALAKCQRATIQNKY